MKQRVLIHPNDLPYAKLLSVPDDWLLCWQEQIREQHGGLRKFSAFELYELIHGLYSACSVTLQEAEAAVLEHLSMWGAK